MKWIGYIILIVIQIAGITTIIHGIIGMVTIMIFRNITLSAFISGLILWFGLDLLWIQIYGSRLPILLLGLSFLTQYLRVRVFQKDMINENSKYMIAGEGYAIIAFGIVEIISTSNYKWI